ncbi:MAG: DUF1761 domain-containing protein [Alphaproteobacteria bacterium]
MPKIFGTSLLGILAATIVFYMLGFAWYGFIFAEAWMAANGITEAASAAHAEKLGIMMWVGGIGITLLQVLGLTYVLNQSGASVPMTCAKICGIVALLIALPLMTYGVLYEGRSASALHIDIGHILLGYILVGIVLSFFRGKDAVGE